MGKAFFAFAAGVGLTSLAFVVFDGGLENPPLGLQATAPSQSGPNVLDTTTTAGISRDKPGLTSVAGSYEPPPAPVDFEARVRNLTGEELGRQIDEGNIAKLEIARRDRIARWADQPPPDVPIVLPAEFDWLSEDVSDKHEQIQRESIDPTWSPLTEAELRTYLIENKELTEEYGFPTISCRTTLCEMAFAVHEDADPALAGLLNHERLALKALSFKREVSSLADQPLIDRLDYDSGVLWAEFHIQDGVTSVLWYLKRKED